MSQKRQRKRIGWACVLLTGATAIALLAGCGDSMFGTSRSLPAPLRNDFPYEFTGRQSGYVGGDSVQLMVAGMMHFVVLAGSDAPKPGQPFYREAQAELRRLIGWKPVRVIVAGRDSHEREIGFVFVAKESAASPSGSPIATTPAAPTETEVDVGLELIRLGLGWYDGQEFDDADNYQRAEDDARAVNLGLWVNDNPIPPWEYK